MPLRVGLRAVSGRRPGGGRTPRPATGAARAGVLLACLVALTACSGDAARPATAHPATDAAPALRPRAGSGGGAVPATSAGAALLRLAVRDAVARGWARIDSTTTGSAGHRIVFADTDGPSSGRQAVTVDGHHAEVVLVGPDAYVRADLGALHGFFGFPVDVSEGLVGRWVEVDPTDAAYAAISSGITIRSSLLAAALARPAGVRPTTFAGRRVLAIAGAPPAASGVRSGAAVVYVTPGRDPLPVAEVLTAPGLREVTTYGGWGATARLRAPAVSVPLQSVLPTGTAMD